MKRFDGTLKAFSQVMSSVRHPFASDGHGGGADPGGRYHSLVEHLEQVVFEIDAAGSWTFLNTSWEKVSGYPVDQSLGSRYSDYIHPQDRERFGQFLEQLIGQHATPGQAVSRLLTRDGTVRWIEVQGKAAANPVGCVVGIFNDITERVRDEGLLLASHRTLTGLINDLPGMVYRCRNNRDWTMAYVSRGSAALTGYSPEDIIDSKALAYGSLIHPDDAEQVWEKVQSALHEERGFELEYRIETADRTQKCVWERGKGVFAESGELICLEGFITDITDRKKGEERLRGTALYDAGTGLCTPVLFLDHLQHAVDCANSKRGEPFALLMVHIDRLHKALSRCNANAADPAFLEISQRLKQILTAPDLLTRMRDDRYLILLPGVSDIQQVTELTERLQAQLLPPVAVSGSQVYVTASIGIALSESRYRGRRDDILRDAEIALDRARALGGARQEVFDLHLNARAAALSQMGRELQRALERDELRVYWQPAVSLRDGHFAGLEARLAWPHARRGLLFAEQFVPMVEDTQIIGPLWKWMLEEICRQMRVWRERGHFREAGEFGITIQISGRTLLDADFILRLGDDLQQNKPAAFSLALGVSEHALLRAPRAVEDISKRLKARNIRLILDDFGSAYSSLALLKSMPIDLLRLVPSLFGDDDREARFGAAIVSFAHAVGVRVIADGVNCAETLAAVRKLGCDYAQGDFVSAPLDAQALIDAVESGGLQGLYRPKQRRAEEGPSGSH